jgi:hypothetical protein
MPDDQDDSGKSIGFGSKGRVKVKVTVSGKKKSSKARKSGGAGSRKSGGKGKKR